MGKRSEKVFEKENQELGKRFVKTSFRTNRKAINLEEIED
jgi:hypothetical protein